MTNVGGSAPLPSEAPLLVDRTYSQGASGVEDNMPLPWFRMLTAKRNDKRLDRLSDSDFRMWFRLVCFAAEQPERGVIDVPPQLLAWEVADGSTLELSAVIQRLETLTLVKYEEGCRLEFIGFREEQDDRSDSHELAAKRQQRFREKQKALRNVTGVTNNAEEMRRDEIREDETDTQSTAPLDLRVTNEDQRINDPRFPTLKEVELFFKSCGRDDEEACWEQFYYHYDAQGWRLGNGIEVSNWKSLAGKWMRKNPKATLETPMVMSADKPLYDAYVKPPNPIVEERKQLEEMGGTPMPENVRMQFAALGLGCKRTPRIDGGLERIGE